MNVDFVTAIKVYFANYINFRGRSTRAEYWWAMLFVVILSLITSFIDSGTLQLLVTFALMLPTWAVTTRRMHDIGKSGWWVVGFFIVPVIVLGVSFHSMFSAIANGVTNPMVLSQIILDSPLSYSIGEIIVLAVYIYMLVLLVKPSGPDNKYGPCPYGNI